MANLSHVGQSTIFYAIVTILLCVITSAVGGSREDFPSIIVPFYLFVMLTYIGSIEAHLRAIAAAATARQGLKGFVAAATARQE